MLRITPRHTSHRPHVNIPAPSRSLKTQSISKVAIPSLANRRHHPTPGIIKLPGTRYYSMSGKNYSDYGASFKKVFAEVDLHSLGGYEEEYDQLVDLIKYLQNPDKYTRKGIKAPKGVIIDGPPGVGKTILAKAIAGHAGVPIIHVSAPELEMKGVGDTEQKLRELFHLACQSAPCVLCIDEIDTIASKRISIVGASAETRTHSRYINSTVNQLLDLLSTDHPGVVVVGITNLFDDLDPAVTREERFDKRIHLTLPNLEARKSILKKVLKNKKLGLDISIDELAISSDGFSGAKLTGWVNQASLIASKLKKPLLEQQHFDEAQEILVHGIQKNSNNLTTEQKIIVATHELGHALVGHFLNRKFKKVTINPAGNSLGHTVFTPKPGTQVNTAEDLLNEICIALAGRAANNVFNVPIEGFEDDLRKAKEIAQRMVYREGMGSTLTGMGSDIELIMKEQMKRAQEKLKANESTFMKVRNLLIQQGIVYRKDFLNLIGEKETSQASTEKLQKNFQSPFRLNLPRSRLNAHRKIRVEEKEKTTFRFPEIQDKLPFTNNEIEKALGIKENGIRRIQLIGSRFEIKFKPSAAMMIANLDLEKTLKEQDVDCRYDESDKELTIFSHGLGDFIRFVKEKSKQ